MTWSVVLAKKEWLLVVELWTQKKLGHWIKPPFVSKSGQWCAPLHPLVLPYPYWTHLWVHIAIIFFQLPDVTQLMFPRTTVHSFALFSSRFSNISLNLLPISNTTWFPGFYVQSLFHFFHPIITAMLPKLLNKIGQHIQNIGKLLCHPNLWQYSCCHSHHFWCQQIGHHKFLQPVKQLTIIDNRNLDKFVMRVLDHISFRRASKWKLNSANDKAIVFEWYNNCVL